MQIEVSEGGRQRDGSGAYVVRIDGCRAGKVSIDPRGAAYIDPHLEGLWGDAGPGDCLNGAHTAANVNARLQAEVDSGRIGKPVAVVVHRNEAGAIEAVEIGSAGDRGRTNGVWLSPYEWSLVLRDLESAGLVGLPEAGAEE